MKAKYFMQSVIVMLLLASVNRMQAQTTVGIGTETPNNSSALDITSSNQGVLIPRVDLTGTNDTATITNGNVVGLLVYNTVTVSDVTPGFYYWSGGVWERLNAGNIPGDNLGDHKATQNLDLAGNLLLSASGTLEIGSSGGGGSTLIGDGFGVVTLRSPVTNINSQLRFPSGGGAGLIRTELGQPLTLSVTNNGTSNDLVISDGSFNINSAAVSVGDGFAGVTTLASPLTQINSVLQFPAGGGAGLFRTAGGQPLVFRVTNGGTADNLVLGDNTVNISSATTSVTSPNISLGNGFAGSTTILSPVLGINGQFQFPAGGGAGVFRSFGGQPQVFRVTGDGTVNDLVITNNLIRVGSVGSGETSIQSLSATFGGNVGMGMASNTNRLSVNGNASKSTAGDWLANSDARLKKNIHSLNAEETLQQMLRLQGVVYEWDDDKTGNERPKEIQYGFTAQNIQKVFPTLVSEDNLGYLQTAYGTYDAMTVEAIRALYTRIVTLEKENVLLSTNNNNLQDTNQVLAGRLDRVEVLLQEVLAKPANKIERGATSSHHIGQN